MFLAAMPDLIRTILLVLAGAGIGAAVNWAIYQLQFFSQRAISPWQTRDEKAPPRTALDFIPVFGWWGLRREAKVHGKGFWIRPLLIELTWAFGLPWFYDWQTGGGLTEGVVVGISPTWFETWFLVQTVLIALMFAATFIDFDEKMIPDSITVPGTLFALLIGAVAPWSRLPIVISTLGGNGIKFLDYCSPQELDLWHRGGSGLAVALAIFSLWVFALLPKWIDWRHGLRAIKYMFAGIIRPPRKTKCDLRTIPRRPHTLTKVLTAIWLLGTVAIAIGWLVLPDLNRDSLFSALVGMGVGGGLVWAIRIVGSYAMNQEAMGFGDVVLMSMIGAFLGWQPSLMVVFALAPFSAIFIALAYFVLTKKSELAFGPYLCFGSLVLILFWNAIWPVGAGGLFAVGGKFLVVVGVIAFLLMAAMLLGIQWIKSLFLPAEEDEGRQT